MLSDDSTAVVSDGVLLRTLVDRVSAMVAYWDSSQRCRFANEAYLRWFGIAPRALIGKHLSELLGPLYALNLPYIDRVLQGEPQEFEREIPSPSGGSRHSLANYIPHTVDGVVRGFFALVTDVSGLKQTQQSLTAALAGERHAREQAEAANQQLQRSEERFRHTIDEAPIGMALVASDGRFFRVNRVLCEIVGRTTDELMGLTFQEITHPDDLQADVAALQQLARGEIDKYQLGKRYIRKDGAIVDVMVSRSAVRDLDGAPIYYVIQVEDITERKRLADQLRIAEAKSSGILSISADAIISVDERGCITMFNESAERMFGYSKAEVLGASLEILIPERLRSLHRQHVDTFAIGTKAAGKMGGRGRALLGRRKSGEEFFADAAISKLNVDSALVLTVALRDITEERRAEEQQRFLAEAGPILAASLDYEETLTTIAELVVRDIADLCIVDIVSEDREVHRLKVASRSPSQAWLCELLMEIAPDTNRYAAWQPTHDVLRPIVMHADDAIATLADSEQNEVVLRAAGTHSLLIVPLLAHLTVVGAITFVSSRHSRTYGPADVAIAQQLAERAALAIENARLYRAARAATQARDEIMAIVAHDLRTPLNSILLNVSVLRLGAEAGEAGVAHHTDSIARAVTRMDRLLQDLLDVTLMEAGQLAVDPARVTPSEIISDCVEAHKLLAATTALELRLDVAADLPEIWADRDRLLQILENLLGNAVKFTGEGGCITIGAARLGDEVMFWVTDTGQGISAADLPQVFDRFWQSRKAERRGAGLGLHIVKGLVEAHQGRIWVESTFGRGSAFRFTIPMADRRTARRS